MYRLLRNSSLLLCTAALGLTSSALDAEGDAGKYKIVKKLPLQGDGRWDYVTVDPESHRVYIARATHVSVLDSETGAVIGDIPDTPGVHGVAVAPDLGLGFISEGGAAKVAVFDLKTFKVESTIATGENPDSILYHPATHLLFVQNGKSKSTACGHNEGICNRFSYICQIPRTKGSKRPGNRMSNPLDTPEY
jgi:DNA-binding beta-propeller fold protein YncE